ncbi:MAG: UvrB/UvrC motif-containing protein [Planctomycetota bacterium]|nr:UvrB/UvrC motif-containing protein [Planctomycetota bacterium]
MYHIKLCYAPCLGKITASDYQETIRSLLYFLDGKREELRGKLERLMNNASARLSYERAALYRDQLYCLQNISRTGKLGAFYEEPLLSQTPAEKLKMLKQVLGLPNIPSRIEAVDVSDIKGTQATGAVVVFINGEPDKTLYRRFKIKQVPEGIQDDYASIAEVVRRRFTRLVEGGEGGVRVDLLLIDGGKGHIKTVCNAFSEVVLGSHPSGISLRVNHPVGSHHPVRERERERDKKQPCAHTVMPKTDPPVRATVPSNRSPLADRSASGGKAMNIQSPPVIVGLAKGKGRKETVYLLKDNSITRFRMSADLKLLDYIRDEAHRFARKYHHLRRSKAVRQE